MNACLKLITAVLGFAVAASSLGDASAKTIATKIVAKPHAAAAKTIAHEHRRLHVGHRVVAPATIARGTPKAAQIVKPLGTKKVLVKKALGAKKVFAAKRLAKKAIVKPAVAKKVLARKTSTKRILAGRAVRGTKIVHVSTKRPLAQKQAMLHRASVKKSVIR